MWHFWYKYTIAEAQILKENLSGTEFCSEHRLPTGTEDWENSFDARSHFAVQQWYDALTYLQQMIRSNVTVDSQLHTQHARLDKRQVPNKQDESLKGD